MPINLEQWVKGLELPEAEQKAVLDALGKGGDKTIKYLEGNQLRQDEFSRKLNDLQTDVKKKEKELEVRMANENTYHTSLATWETKRKKELTDATAAREKAERSLAAAREKVTALAQEYEIPETEITPVFEGAPASGTNDHRDTNRNDNSNRFDSAELDQRYVTTDRFTAEARAYAQFAALIPSLEREYFKLFGENAEAPDWEKVIAKTVEAKQPIKAVFESEYKISEKRAELQKAAITADLEKARQEGAAAERAKLLAENPALGHQVRSGEREGSPVLTLARAQEKKANEGKPPISHGPSAVEAAVAAFHKGTYKVGNQSAA